MEIPYERLDAAVLRSLVEEFVSRDGTDYGEKEAAHERKVEQVLEMIRVGKVKIVFDSETESCDLREAKT